jgi:hypothetical protein
MENTAGPTIFAFAPSSSVNSISARSLRWIVSPLAIYLEEMVCSPFWM